MIKNQEIRPEQAPRVASRSPLLLSGAERSVKLWRLERFALSLRRSDFLVTVRGVRNKTERGTSEDLIPSMPAFRVCVGGSPSSSLSSSRVLDYLLENVILVGVVGTL